MQQTRMPTDKDVTCSPQAPAVDRRVRHQETDDEEEQVCRGADHRRASGARGRIDDGGSLPASRDCRSRRRTINSPLVLTPRTWETILAISRPHERLPRLWPSKQPHYGVQ